MTKKYNRFYGGFITLQEKWLNKMAANGYRLVKTGMLAYEFEECEPSQYQYKVEFIGNKSKENADDYAHFLEDCGYRVFFKNINLDYSYGKIEGRPWADPGGRWSTDATTHNRELLIIEKVNDGQDFEIHSTYDDQLKYQKDLRKPTLFLFFLLAFLGITLQNWVCGIFAILCLIPLGIHQKKLTDLKKKSKTKEW